MTNSAAQRADRSTTSETGADEASPGRRLAIVTGGSAGIGAATAIALAGDGWDVVVGSRRQAECDKIASQCRERGVKAWGIELDITDDDSIAAAVDFVAPRPVDLLVNNAGGARGLDPVAEANLDDWRWMYETNVLGTLRMTNAFLPALEKSDAPQVINVVSIAGRGAYRGGAGYNAAKFGETALTDVMRMEFAERNIRVCQLDPGRVETEFSINRFKGDADRAAEVYADKHNLTAEDMGETIRWVAGRPAHMDVESIMIRPIDQV